MLIKYTLKRKDPCSRCSLKWQTLDKNGWCKRCITNMDATGLWLKGFKRHRAAVRGWETRKAKKVSVLC